MDRARLIAELRNRVSPDGIEARVSGEKSAVELLDAKAGSFDEADGWRLAHLIQASYWDGKLSHSRFAPAFAGGSWAGLLGNIDAFNEYTTRMWRGTDDEALEGLDQVFRDRGVLPNAGTAYPSLLLYLRAPERFLVATARLARGLTALTGVAYPLRSGQEYLAFCSSAHHLRVRYDLAPQEVDLLLWGATEPSFGSFVPEMASAPLMEDRVLAASQAPDGGADVVEQWLRENENRAAVLPIGYLASRAAAAPRVPQSRSAMSQSYVRDAYVSALAKALADGHCDLCRRPAPFLDTGNHPYLEAHHIMWLANGGPDAIENVVALCPNCHRKMHVRGHGEDVDALTRRVRNRPSLAVE